MMKTSPSFSSSEALLVPDRTDNTANRWQELFPYPATRFDLDGHQLSYVDHGLGRPIVMVHGNPTWSFFYYRLIEVLSKRNRVVAVDNMGCGRSDKPAAYPYTLSQHVANLKALISQLDLRDAALIAHDWGGAIGLGAAVDMPDRFSALVLMNTAAFPPPYVPWQIRVCRIPFLGTFGIRGLNLFVRGALRMASEREGGLEPHVAAGLKAPYNSWRNRIAIDRFVNDIPVRPSQPTWKLLAHIESRLETLTMPKLIVWGMRDWCFRAQCIDRFLKHWPETQVVRLPEAGHYVLLDEPEKVTAAVDRFLSKNGSQCD